MGTNYYMAVNGCECCGRYDDIHIGKSSFGWAFLFHSRFPTKKDWEVALSDPDIIIKDEYHDDVSKEDFWEMVESKKDKMNAFTYDGKYSIEDPSKYEYLDEEGYRFCKHGDFS